MPIPETIPAYLDALSVELSFDSALSRRVCDEVRDHLEEAVAARTTMVPHENERRVLARFGTPHQIAEEFARSAQRRTARGITTALALGVVGVAAGMAARIASIPHTNADGVLPRATASLAATVDAASFVVAVVAGIVAFACAKRRAADAKSWRVALLFATLATAALAISVVSDGLGAFGAGRVGTVSQAAPIALISMGLECTVSALLAVCVGRALRRSAHFDRFFT